LQIKNMGTKSEKVSLLSSTRFEGYTTIQNHDDHDLEIQTLEPATNNTRWFGATLMITNIVLGTGLLNYPHVFSQAGGILPCILMQLFALSLVQCSLLLIAKCTDLSGKCSFQDIAQFYTGKFGAIIANIFIVIHDIGTCVAYLVLIADQLDQVMYEIAGETFCHKWYMNRNFTLVIVAALIILPMCFPKDINSFRFGSALGIFSTFYMVGLVVAKYYIRSSRDLNGMYIRPEKEKSLNVYDIFKIAPAIIFSFESHIEIVPIYASFKKRSLKEISKSIFGTSILALTIYNLLGIYGYLTFFGHTKSDILISYRNIDAAVIIAMLAVALKAILTYPIVFYCARLVFLQSMENSSLFSKTPELIRRIGITTILFTITCILALTVPSIGAVIALLGGSASLFIFVFPGLCFFMAHFGKNTKGDILKMLIGAFYLCIGAFIVGATFTQSFISFNSGELSQTEIECI